MGVASSDGDPAPRLHLAAVRGAGFEPGRLQSPSTRRTPYIRLSDIAPTVLGLLGHDVQAGVTGLPVTGGGAGRPAGVVPTATALVDLDRAAGAHRAAVAPFFAWYGLLLLLVFGIYALIRRRGGAPRTAAGAAALLLAAVPAGTFLANLVPWWRAPYPPASATGRPRRPSCVSWTPTSTCCSAAPHDCRTDPDGGHVGLADPSAGADGRALLPRAAGPATATVRGSVRR